MGRIADNIKAIKDSIPADVQLVAVSKFHPVEKLRQAYEAGQRLFGESRVQELSVKRPQLPDDVEWHFIGHLQTNKVRQLLGCVDVIDSVDSLRLLNVINTEAGKLGKRVKVLLQLHVALEEQKFGFSPEELLSIAESGLAMNYGNIDFCGIMAMATNTEDEAEIRKEFGYAKSVYSAMRSGAFSGCAHFNTISMGMSGDYQIAIEEGSTMIRIGTFIFGEREY